MMTSLWIALVWIGAALLILLLPFIMSDWTSFGIALGIAMVVVWMAFRPGRNRKGDGERET